VSGLEILVGSSNVEEPAQAPRSLFCEVLEGRSRQVFLRVNVAGRQAPGRSCEMVLCLRDG
jgi:hypothetical protein